MSDRAPTDSDILEGTVLSEADADVFFAPAPLSSEGILEGSPIIVLPEGCSRGDAVAILSRDIGTNQYGLPQYFIRSDLLSMGANLTQDDVDSAAIGLFYQEGYPTLEDGTAFWNQLPHEPQTAHNYFQKYIEQAQEEGIRQLDLLAVSLGVDLIQLKALYHEFYWSVRARAYDLFITAAGERKRQLRVRTMEDAHFNLAAQRLQALEAKFAIDPNDPESSWINELNAKEAIEALIELAKLQRLSLGLTGQHASSQPSNPLPPGASAQTIMEHLTRGANLAQEGQDNFLGRLNALLHDPEQGMQVQEAILRIGRSDSMPTRSDAGVGEDT
jgi:hypothetical protein